MLNNNFIGALIAILISVLFAFKLNDNTINNKKENYAGGMPQRRITSHKGAAFIQNKDCGDPSKVQFYSVSSFQSNPSQRGTNPEVGPLLRTQLKNAVRLSNDIRIQTPCNNNVTNVENFEDMVHEGFDSNCRSSAPYASLPLVEPEYAAGNYNEMKKDVIISDMMPVGDMRAAVDDEGNPGNIVNFQSFMYSNLKDSRNNRDGDFIRGDLAIPQNKGTCWFGQRGYSLRPSALGMLGGDDSSSKKESFTSPRMMSSQLGAASGDLIVENQTGYNTSSFF